MKQTINNTKQIIMKKYLFIAAIAIAAMACTKVEVDSFTPNKEVKFQVANYTLQTKAGEGNSLVTELTGLGLSGSDIAFKTKAFLHAEGVNVIYNADLSAISSNESKQDFFGSAGETITWNSSSHEWAPSHVYYWPKSDKSYINFFSWYDYKEMKASGASPSLSYTLTSGSWTATMTWTDRVIGTTDDILFANPAWRYKTTNPSATYGHDSVTEGVPTLFHHALAQLCVKAKATKVEDTNATWNITLSDASISDVYSTGSLELTITDPYTATTLPATATPTNATAWTVTGGNWTSKSGTNAALSLAALSSSTPLTTSPVDILAQQNILPQTTSGKTLTIKVHITTTYKSAPTNPNNEIITVNIPLSSFTTTAPSAWAMNTRYTYTLIVDPATNKVLLDPAVEAWTEVPTGDATVQNQI